MDLISNDILKCILSRTFLDKVDDFLFAGNLFYKSLNSKRWFCYFKSFSETFFISFDVYFSAFYFHQRHNRHHHTLKSRKLFRLKPSKLIRPKPSKLIRPKLWNLMNDLKAYHCCKKQKYFRLKLSKLIRPTLRNRTKWYFNNQFTTWMKVNLDLISVSVGFPNPIQFFASFHGKGFPMS